MFKSCKKRSIHQSIDMATWQLGASHTSSCNHITSTYRKKGWKLIYLCIYFWMYYAFIWQAIIYHLTFHDVLFCIKGHKQPKHGQYLSCRFQTSLTSPFKQCSPPIGTRTTQCRQYHTYKKQHPPWSKDVISADLYPRIVIAHVPSYYLIPYPSQKRIWLHLILTTRIW